MGTFYKVLLSLFFPHKSFVKFNFIILLLLKRKMQSCDLFKGARLIGCSGIPTPSLSPTPACPVKEGGLELIISTAEQQS